MSEGAVKKQERRKFQAIRGVRDLLPPETELWNHVEQTAHQVFSTYSFGEIRLPLLEDTELFARAVGRETDIVNKEMFSFLGKLEILRRATVEQVQDLKDRVRIQKFGQALGMFVSTMGQSLILGELQAGPSDIDIMNRLRDISETVDRWNAQKQEPSPEWDALFEKAKALISSLDIERVEEAPSLRPEATASVCRAYIEHNMQQLPQPVKLYYMGPMFRRERPQKGRYRQFYQIGAEVLGGPDAPALDAEVIEMVMTFFDKLGLEGVQLDINSIGCSNCRPKYAELLRNELTKVKDRLGPDSQRRIETNALRVLDSKVESEQPIIAKLPRIADHLCDDCKIHYAAVKRELDLRGVKYRENWRLVRGLDYYMRTTFEVTAPGLGSQNAVCGGGRYDSLVELLGGPPTRGIGFAIGEDRLILSLQQGKAQSRVAGHQSLLVYIAWMGEKAYATAIRAAKELRSAGFSVELPPVEQKIGKALGQADKLGAKYALILGENEVSSGEWTLKTLASGEQAKYTKAGLLQILAKEQRLRSSPT